jgi:hypothetical protein
MSTLSSPQSASPSFPKAIFSLVAFIVYPILCLMWIFKMLKSEKPLNALPFLMCMIIGSTALWIGLNDSDTRIIFKFLSVFLYLVGLIGTMAFIRIIKDESHGTYVRS